MVDHIFKYVEIDHSPDITSENAVKKLKASFIKFEIPKYCVLVMLNSAFYFINF